MKRLYTYLCTLLAVAAAYAGQRSEAEMRACALARLAGVSEVKSQNSPGVSPLTVTEALTTDQLSVYTPASGNGFVVVSRDDAFPAVIAYGSTRFDAADIPCGLQWWLRQAEERLRSRKPVLRTESAYKAVRPFLTTKWGQGTPYNDLAPMMGGRRTPAGCVATAMAQVINYNQFPTSVDFSGRYRTGGEETVKTAFVKSTYAFPYKKAYGYYYPDGYVSDDDVLREEYSDDEATAIATLLRDCGYGIEMNYADGGSGASVYIAADALLRKFGYPELSVMFYMRSFYTDAEWNSLIYKELSLGYPVIYGGQDEQSGGHAFVIHGCDADGLVYVNWGWDGHSDGYYDVNLMNPDGYQFSASHHIVTGLHPTPLTTDHGFSLLVAPEPFTLRTARGRIALYFTSPLYNLAPVDLYGRIALIMQDKESDDVIITDIIEPGEGPRSQYPIFDGLLQTTAKGEPGHSYQVFVASLQDTELEWQPVRTYGGTFAYDLSVDATGKHTFSERHELIPTAICVPMADAVLSADATTRVFDASGRQVYSAPTSSFNLWDIPARGVLVVKQGNRVRKVVR